MTLDRCRCFNECLCGENRYDLIDPDHVVKMYSKGLSNDCNDSEIIPLITIGPITNPNWRALKCMSHEQINCQYVPAPLPAGWYPLTTCLFDMYVKLFTIKEFVQ